MKNNIYDLIDKCINKKISMKNFCDKITDLYHYDEVEITEEEERMFSDLLEAAPLYREKLEYDEVPGFFKNDEDIMKLLDKVSRVIHKKAG